MDDLYREVILEHYKNPVHKGELDAHNHDFEDENPLCGDFIHMDLQVDENGVVRYTFRPSSPFCPIAVPLSLAIQQAVADVPGVSKQNMEIVDLFLQEDLIEYLKEAMKDYNQ